MIKKNITYIVILLITFSLLSQNEKLNLDYSKKCTNKNKQFNVKINKQNDAILGTYVLKSCENSRFKIILKKKGNDYFYSIFDWKKIISKGKAKVTYNKEYTSIMFGLIGGIGSGKDIQIQNYGNEMNQFIHFTQCDEKFLTFEKNQHY